MISLWISDDFLIIPQTELAQGGVLTCPLLNYPAWSGNMQLERNSDLPTSLQHHLSHPSHTFRAWSNSEVVIKRCCYHISPWPFWVTPLTLLILWATCNQKEAAARPQVAKAILSDPSHNFSDLSNLEPPQKVMLQQAAAVENPCKKQWKCMILCSIGLRVSVGIVGVSVKFFFWNLTFCTPFKKIEAGSFRIRPCMNLN